MALQDTDLFVVGRGSTSYHYSYYNIKNGINAGLATEGYVDSAVGLATAGLATEDYVNSSVGLATAGLASETYVGLATAGLASETYVGLATAGLASETYVDTQVGLATAGLASEAFVGLATAGLATEDYVDSSVYWTLSGTNLSPSNSGDNLTNVGNITGSDRNLTIKPGGGTTDRNLNLKPNAAGAVSVGSTTAGTIQFRSATENTAYRFYQPGGVFYGAFKFDDLTAVRTYTLQDIGGEVAMVGKGSVDSRYALDTRIDNLVLDNLSDVVVGSATTGQAVVWSGTEWIAQTVTVPSALNFQGEIDLTNYSSAPTVTSADAGDLYINVTSGTVDNGYGTGVTDSITNVTSGESVVVTASGNWQYVGTVGASGLTYSDFSATNITETTGSKGELAYNNVTGQYTFTKVDLDSRVPADISSLPTLP